MEDQVLTDSNESVFMTYLMRHVYIHSGSRAMVFMQSDVIELI